MYWSRVFKPNRKKKCINSLHFQFVVLRSDGLLKIFAHCFLFFRILVGAPLGQNPQPNTTQTGTLKRCPITQKQSDCEDVLTDGRYSKFLFENNQSLCQKLKSSNVKEPKL